MNVRCSYSDMLDVTQLRKLFHPKNRNDHPKDQIARLAKIMDYQGIRLPVKISKQSGLITAGHGRVLAAELNGWEKMPVDYQDYDSDDQEYADVQSDNSIASWSQLDMSGINTDLADLGPDFDLDLLGIKGFTLDIEPKKAKEKLDEKHDITITCPSCGEKFKRGSKGEELNG